MTPIYELARTTRIIDIEIEFSLGIDKKQQNVSLKDFQRRKSYKVGKLRFFSQFFNLPHKKPINNPTTAKIIAEKI